VRFIENAEKRISGGDKSLLASLQTQVNELNNRMSAIKFEVYRKLPDIKLENGEYIEDKMEKLGIKASPEVVELRSSLTQMSNERFRIEQEISKIRAKKQPVFPRYGAEESGIQLLQSLTNQKFTRGEDWRKWLEASNPNKNL
jgi:hypothetical protein